MKGRVGVSDWGRRLHSKETQNLRLFSQPNSELEKKTCCRTYHSFDGMCVGL